MRISAPNAGPNSGTIEAVRGSVVDARFPERIPSIFHVLTAGADDSVIIEVLSHLDAHTVRGVALTSTRGLSRRNHRHAAFATGPGGRGGAGPRV
jgi:F-type H+-transporting ATPase subunit beta